ncbi:MAG: hypothetical protein ACJ758_04270 [Actinomycetota bacterium]
METCTNCGATLAEDAEWCGQCFAPVRRAAGGRVIAAPAAPPPGAGAPQGGPGGAPWMRTINAAPPKPDHTPEYSRWKGGPTSMGAVGRSFVSVMIVLGLLIGYPLVRGAMLAFVGFDVPGMGFLGMYAALAIPVGAILLVKVWREQRIS